MLARHRKSATVAHARTALALAALAVAAGVAAPGATASPHGIVPPRNGGTALRAAAAKPPFGFPPLLYNGGQVMTTNTTYAIFWVPSGYSVDPSYESTIGGFFQNVADASGSTGNVYSTDVQYCQDPGNLSSFASCPSGATRIAYQSTFGGAYTDTRPFPADAVPASANGCADGERACLTDAEIQDEVEHAMSANGWSGGPTHVFFVFTPDDVGSCFDDQGDCSFTTYCAYHNAFADGTSFVAYANIPYAAYDESACGVDEHPNGGAADDAINVVSHEHNEAITDPTVGDPTIDGGLGGWWDLFGYENGDECAWYFGKSLGGPSGAQWNQVINGGHYYLQGEWSNSDDACAFSYGASGSGPSAPAIASFSPSKGAAGAQVAIHGSGFTGTTEVDVGGVPAASFVVVGDGEVDAVVPQAATTGPITVTTPAGTATSKHRFTVLPAITSFSPAAAPTGSTVTITGSGFSAVKAVTVGGAKAAFTVVSSVEIDATVPANARTGPIAVKTSAGKATSAAPFAVTPTISGFTPTSAPSGATVTIVGTGLRGATAVTFAGVPATFGSVKPTSLRAKVPAGATSGTIAVTTPGGVATSPTPFTVS